MPKPPPSDDAPHTGPSDPKNPASPPPNAVKDSAQQIWLAGLGAFAKAQEEGSKVFEGLVREGLGMQRKTQAAAEEKLAEATNRLTDVASGLAAKAGGQWDKLEGIFESRVAKAAQNIGMPTLADIEALNARLDTMQKTLDTLVQLNSANNSAKPSARKMPARKAPSKATPGRTKPPAK